MKCIVSGSLILSFLLALFPSAEALAAMAPMEERAGQKAAYYREIIMRDVPECTWDADTQTSHTTALYDPSGNVNGYIYEYVNGEGPAGFLQIDVSMGEPVLDSYTFGDEHCAARELRNLPAAISGETDTEKLVYLGGYAYCLLGETDEEGNTEVYDVLNHTETAFDRPAAVKAYEEDVAAKRQMRAEEAATRSSTMSTRGANTITKFVQGYTGGMNFATYSNTGDPGNGCTILAAVNSCMYWTKCRGKTGLFTSVPATYNAIKPYISMENQYGTSCSKSYDGYRNYLRSKGFEITIYGKIFYENWSWSAMKEVIDKNVPLTMTELLGYNGLNEITHANVIFGYQYIDIVNTVMIADGRTNTLVYKSFSSLKHATYSTMFSYYAGRWS